MSNWRLFLGNGRYNAEATERLTKLEPPPWRRFGDRVKIDEEKDGERWQQLRENIEPNNLRRGETFRISPEAKDAINAVNAAIYLRRPLLITGKPGSGKTSLAYAIARELGLGSVLSWAIDARSTLREGLYSYDALARLQDTNQDEKKAIDEYITLGPVGTAFLPSRLPRVLLIDEIDKSDINLPNDLLNLFEEGKFKIDELVRRSDRKSSDGESVFEVDTQDRGQGMKAKIIGGWVYCLAFPIIVMTSNGERDFPPAFKRRCLRVRMPDPKKEALVEIVKAHFGLEFLQERKEKIDRLISDFRPDDNKSVERATDQLLNSIYLLTQEVGDAEESLKETLLRRLDLTD